MGPTIVLDTNALLKILGVKSPYHFLLQDFQARKYTLCVSTEILLEYEEILKAKASTTTANIFLNILAISDNVVKCSPYYRLGIISADYDDNKFVDCAFACDADYIVTDDSHFEEVKKSPFPLFHVIGLDDFKNLMAK